MDDVLGHLLLNLDRGITLIGHLAAQVEPEVFCWIYYYYYYYSGEHWGQPVVSLPSSSRNCLHISTNYYCQLLLCTKRNPGLWVTSPVEVRVSLCGYAFPDHHQPTTKPDLLNDITSSIAFSTASLHPFMSATLCQMWTCQFYNSEILWQKASDLYRSGH